MILAYTGPEPLSLAEVKRHCRVDGDEEDELFEFAIIPGARALAESKTGAAIRHVRRCETVTLPGPLEVGQVLQVESVTVDGAPVVFTCAEAGRRTVVAADGLQGAQAVVTYTAGIALEQHPSVRSWMLLACGAAYAQREIIAPGQALQEMPRHYTDTMLASIDVPAAL